jgi:hypothetical protein
MANPRYLDLKPSEVNVDEIVKATYVALGQFATRSTPGGGVTIEIPLEYYPGAAGWSVWFSVEPHWESYDPNSANFGRTLIHFQVDYPEDPHYADSYESFLSGLEVELSGPTRTVVMPSAPFLTEKPVSYIAPEPP